MDFLRTYFDLGILPLAEPTLGGAKKKQAKDARRKALARKRLWLTLLMYLGVCLGVLAQAFMSILGSGQPLSWATIGPGSILLSLIVATVIFPQVFPKVFGKMEEQMASGGEDLGAGRRVVQFCVAFQNGFFWQALLKSISQLFVL